MDVELQDGDTVVIIRPTDAGCSAMSSTINPASLDPDDREYYFVMGCGLVEMATSHTDAVLGIGAHTVADLLEAEDGPLHDMLPRGHC